MDQSRVLVTVLMALLLFNQTILSTADSAIYRIISDFIQNNLAGNPSTHQKTEWDFDPEVGKQRRVQYEKDNGRFGEYAIAKLGMGIGYKGSWNTPVQI